MKAGKSDTGKKPRRRTIASPMEGESERSRRIRRKNLELPGRIVLNAQGADFFAGRAVNLHRFDAPDGDFRFGFRLRTIDVPWLRRLLLAQFVEKADFPVREVAAVKNELTDLSRLLVFSILYNHFNASVLSLMMGTDVIHRWNRQHPQQALDARKAVSPPELRSAMLLRKAAVNEVKDEIAAPVRQSLRIDSRRTPEDCDRLSLFVVDLLEHLDPLAYFVLLASPPDQRKNLIRAICDELGDCLDKTDLADYLVLMVLELMSAAERTTLIELIGPGHTPDGIREMLENSDARSRLLSSLPNGLSASMVWSLSRKWSLGKWRYRLKLSLHDGTSSFEEGKRLFDERGSLAVRDRSLQAFYEQGTGPYGDDGLGWYYLSFLAEACSSMGIHFDASVRERKNKGTAAVNLSFVF